MNAMKPAKIQSSPSPRDGRRIHCLGVGGMGVAPLAIYLSGSGCTVSGEDDALTDEVGVLLDRAHVTVGPLPAQVDRVVYSSAIPASHPAYAAAAARGVPLVRRGEMLAEAVRGRRLVAVCGAHGKTTTSAMLVTALRHANFPAGYLVAPAARSSACAVAASARPATCWSPRRLWCREKSPTRRRNCGSSSRRNPSSTRASELSMEDIRQAAFQPLHDLLEAAKRDALLALLQTMKR